MSDTPWIVADNSASFDGGGISNGDELTVTASTIADNSSLGGGGGIYNTDKLSVDDSTIASTLGWTPPP